MKTRWKLIALAAMLSLACAFGLMACSSSSGQSAQSSQSQTSSKAADTRTITDMDGNSVTVPANVQSVGTSWPGFVDTICVTGAGDKVTVTPAALKSYAWAYKVFPNLSNGTTAFGSSGADIEKLVAAKPDVLFLRSSDDVDKIKETGIPVVMVDYKNNSIYDMVGAVKLVGEVTGGDAQQQAQQYSDFVDGEVSKINAVTSTIPDAQKPTVVALSVTGNKLSTWGKDIIQNEEIQMAGGINAAANDIKGSKEVSTEQVLAWNPQYIFLTGSAADRASLLSNEQFAQLDAVKNNRVYVVPKGLFLWSNLGAETALYLPWMAKTLYPTQLADLDMNQQTKDFYQTFFKYTLTDDDVARIMNEQDPA